MVFHGLGNLHPERLAAGAALGGGDREKVLARGRGDQAVVAFSLPGPREIDAANQVAVLVFVLDF